MERDEFIEEITIRIRKLVADVYDAGVRAEASRSEELRKNLAMLIGVSPEMTMGALKRSRVSSPRKNAGQRIRAPKGAVGEILERVFVEGLTTKELENRALSIDPLINTKSIYNELWRRPDMHRQDGRWYRRPSQNAPPADHGLPRDGSAGGNEPAQTSWTSARAPVATGGVGGT